MVRNIISSLYKLFKDRPFKITLIIGLVLAVLLTLVNLDNDSASAYYMLNTSCSPTMNFGIAVPINFVTFVIGEYNYGTIRNKIIAGNRRSNIYFSLFIAGILFSLILMTSYVGLSVVLGGVMKGWGSGSIENILSHILLSVLVFIMLSALALLVASSIRHHGLANTILVLFIMAGLITALIYLSSNGFEEIDKIDSWIYIVNPLFYHSINTISFTVEGINDASKALPYASLGMVIYGLAFFFGGLYLFEKRDIK